MHSVRRYVQGERAGGVPGMRDTQGEVSCNWKARIVRVHKAGAPER